MRPTLTFHTVGLRVEIAGNITEQTLNLRATHNWRDATSYCTANTVYHDTLETNAGVVDGSGVVEGKIAG